MIEWRRATSRDKRLLQGYACADPDGGTFDNIQKLKTHTEPWAIVVQKGLRKWRSFHVDGRELWLGFEGDELVAAGSYDRATEPDATVGRYLIEYVSCAFEWRRRGIGAVCLGQLLADISDRAGGHEVVELVAFVHERNEPSQRLFKSFGFACMETRREQIREGSGKKRPGGMYGMWLAQL